MEELISVILPVYNVEKYVENCLNSIINQTYKNLEIIIVDDKSTDNSRSICAKYLTDSRVTLKLHEVNKGLSGARNTGLAIATGKYVVFIDSDDYIESDMIYNLYSCAVQNQADTVIGGYKRLIGHRIEIKKNHFAGIVYDNSKDIQNFILKKMLASDGNDQIEMAVWRVLFSMDIIRENQLLFPDRIYLCEDIIFDFQYYPLAKKIAMCDDTGYCYRLNDNSLSQMYQKNKFDRIMFQKNEMVRLSKGINFDDEALLRIDNFCIGNLLHHLKTMIANVRNVGMKDCINEITRVCNDESVIDCQWDKLEKCYIGRDKIPFRLLMHKKKYALYFYFRVLTIARKIVRK